MGKILAASEKQLPETVHLGDGPGDFRKYLAFSPDEYRHYQFRQLQYFLEEIQSASKYYRDKLAGIGYINGYEAFAKLPFLGKDDLRLTPIDDIRAADWEDIVSVTTSSGSTGPSKVILWTEAALAGFEKSLALGYVLMKMDKMSRVGLFMPLQLSICLSCFGASRTVGSFCMPFGMITNDVDLDNAIRRMSSLGATHIKGSASRLQTVTERAKRLGYDLKADFRVKYLLGCALAISDSSKKALEAEWGAEYYDHYGANEIGIIGAECEEHNGMHVPPGTGYVEVVDPETLLPITDNKTIGEIVITNFTNLGTPLLRYRIGDLGVISYETCECGLSFPRVFLKGRSSLTLFFGGTKFEAHEINEVLSHFSNATAWYQVILEKRLNAEHACFKIECAAGSTLEESEAIAIAEMLEKASHEIYAKVEMGAVKFHVQLVPFGSLERTDTDKIKDQLIDRRNG